jgi:hypothetical protein
MHYFQFFLEIVSSGRSSQMRGGLSNA